MNDNQRSALITAGVTMVAMLLFPPFRLIAGEGRVLNGGYGFLLSPPHQYATVNTSLLMAQWVLVAILTGGALYMFKDR